MSLGPRCSALLLSRPSLLCPGWAFLITSRSWFFSISSRVWLDPCLMIARNFRLQGPRPAVTKYKQLNAPPVVPDGFTEWNDVMDRWGSKVSGISLPREDTLA